MAESCSDAAALVVASDDGQSDISSVVSSEPEGWNSDDEPPKDEVGDERICSRDAGVKKFIRRVGTSFDQPGQHDIVFIRYRYLPPPPPKPSEGASEDDSAQEAKAGAAVEASELSTSADKCKDVDTTEKFELEVALSEDKLPLAMEFAVRLMRLGEVAEVVGPAAYAAKASPLSGRRLRKAHNGRFPKNNPKSGVPRKLRFTPQAPKELLRAAHAETRLEKAAQPPHFRVEVELVRIEPVSVFTEHGRVRKQLLSPGQGRRKPDRGDLVTFSVAPYAEESSGCQLGEGNMYSAVLSEDVLIYPDLEHVLLSMREGERCLARLLPSSDQQQQKSESDAPSATSLSEVRLTVVLHHWQRRSTVAVPGPGMSVDDIDESCPLIKKFELRPGPERWTYSIEEGSVVLIAVVQCGAAFASGEASSPLLLSWCLGEGSVPRYVEAALTSMRLLEVAEFRTLLGTLEWAPVGPEYEGQTPLRRMSLPEVHPLVAGLFNLQGSHQDSAELPPLPDCRLPVEWRTAGEPVQWSELAIEPLERTGTDISFQIALLAATEAPDVCLLDDEQQKIFLERERAHGNALAKVNRFLEASSAYRKALDTVRRTPLYKALFPTERGVIKGATSRESTESVELPSEEVASRKSTLIALHLNLALCAGKEGNHTEVRRHATTVLGADAENVKALYRRGVAASAQGDYEASLVDLQKVAGLQPQDKAVRDELHELRNKIKRHEAKQKAMFQKAFEPESRVPVSVSEEPAASEVSSARASNGDHQSDAT